MSEENMGSVGQPPVSQPSSTSPPQAFSKEFKGVFNDEAIRYRAHAAETYILDENGSPSASYFTVAYLKIEQADCCRPVTFIFNGGPGSSAQWLHMGALGPKRVVIPPEAAHAGAPPYPMTDNALSILDVADLVFIDPIGTGYSRVLGKTELKNFFGLLEDARSIADFIQTWLTENRRWNSPRYVIAESYGAVRACLLADILHEKCVALNGIVLIAAVLDYQNSRPRSGDGGIMSYASFLPTYAATAWYHGKIKPEGETLNSLMDQVRVFARTEYAQALIANVYRLGSSERQRLVSRIAAFTGLCESYIEQSKLRIPVERFFKELLRDQGMVIGRLDSRYTGIETESAGEVAESDPTFDAIGSSFTSAIHVQLDALGVQMGRPYISTANVNDRWNWLLQDKPPSGGGYINVAPHLGRAMRHNRDLRLLVASGYYDLATPFFGVENALSQDGLAHERIEYTYYEVGHMIFLHEPSRRQLLNDIRKFFVGDLRPLRHAQ